MITLKRKNKVVFIVPGGGGGVASFYNNLEALLEGNIFKTKTSKLHTKNFLVMFIRYLLFIVKHRPDTVVVNPSLFSRAVYRDYVLSRVAELLFSSKIVVFWRGWNPENEYVMIKNPRIFNYFFSKKNLVLNSYVQRILTAKSVIFEKISTSYDLIMEGINVERREINIENILYLGRLERSKGLDEVLAFASQMTGPETVSIAGDGTYIEEVIKSSNVQYLGYLDGREKVDAYLENGIFILPSYSEGMPNAVLEAMRLGLIVIASDVGALSDLITHGVNGFLIKPRSSSELVNCYKQLKEMGPDDLKLISERAQETSKKYSPLIVASKLNLYCKNHERI